ncbi:hypothetical protein T484DRAFT_1746413 [Baffinella frigidus]|nr:hypothetical protein T484DRAFT_1746413 [Cryptophyta sp. CCMP2293]
MTVRQIPLPAQDGVAIAFRSLSIKPLLLPPSSSLKSVSQGRKPSPPLRDSSMQSTASNPGRTSGSERTRFFAMKRSSVHPVLATRYTWRTACAKALSSDTPDEPFLSAMQHRGIAMVKYDSVRPVSSTSLPRPSPLSRPSTEVVSQHLPSSTNNSSRGNATLLDARPSTRRPASVTDTSTPVDFTPATRRRSYDHVTGLCTAGRTERNSLMRLSPPALDASLPLPAGSAPIQRLLSAPLRCAKARAPLPPHAALLRLPGPLRCALRSRAPRNHAPRDLGIPAGMRGAGFLG